MRKLLLGTSALIGATALVASASAAAPELTISGKLNFQWTGGENPAFNNDLGGTSGEDVGNAESGWQFDQINSQSEINFFAEGESDGGLTYGANIDYRYLNSSTDEAYIFVSGDWGTIHLGQDDGAVNQTRFYAGSIAPGGYLIDGTTTYAGYSYGDTSDNSKILYVSNDLSGFKFAVSVMDAVSSGELAKFEDIYEIGASYTADFGDGHIGVSVGYFAASEGDEGPNARQDTDPDTTGDQNGPAFAEHEDLGEYVIGLKAGFGPVSFAGSYADADESGLVKGRSAFGEEAPSQYTLGLAYDIGGGMAVGISYSEETSVATNVSTAAIAVGDVRTETTNELITIDFGFPIMTGMNGYAGIAFSETEAATSTATAATTFAAGTAGSSSTDATTYVIGTTVSF